MLKLKNSLKYKFTVFISALIFFLFFCISLIIIRHERNILYNNLINKGNSLINNFSLYCENAFFTGDELNIEDYVSVMMKDKEIKNIYIVLANQTYFLNSNKDEPLGNKYSEPEKIEMELDGNYNIIRRGKEILYHFYKPVYQINFDGNRLFLGMGYIEITTDMIKKHLYQIIVQLIITFILLLIAGIGGAFFLSSFIINPIKKLIKGINIIGKGNLKHKIMINTGDEIENLAIEFNKMTTQLSSYQQKMIKQKVVEQELKIAQNIQSQIIPEKLFTVKDHEFFSFHKTSSTIGGDYHNLIKVNNHEYLMIIADVSGKGIPASLLMVMFHTILATLKKMYNKPIVLMKEINNNMIPFLKKGNFITCIIGLININTSKIKMVSAGHEYPFCIDFISKKNKFIQLSGVPIGLLGQRDFNSKLKTVEYKILKNSLLLFFTDGIRNLRKNPMNNKMLDKFFKDIIENSNNDKSFKENLLKKVDIRKYHDDITIVGIKRGI